jgi:hypothetical protein
MLFTYILRYLFAYLFGCVDVDWNQLGQNTYQRYASVNTVVDLRVP